MNTRLPVTTRRSRLAGTAIRSLLAGALMLLANLAQAQEPTSGAGASWTPPPFETRTADGEAFRYPEDLDGPTIVVFWATWCPYCKALLPHLQSIRDESNGTVDVLALNIREDDDAAAYLDLRGFDFTLLPEADAVAESWGVRATPGLFLADAGGTVLFSRGAIPEEAYGTTRFEDEAELRHFGKAARRAPWWAARLRQALDAVQEDSATP